MSTSRRGALFGAWFLLSVISTAPGQALPYGSGCSAPGGIQPQILHTGSVTPGAPAQLHFVGGEPGAPVFLVLGTSNTQTASGTPLPMDLSGLGGFHEGCQLLASPDMLLPMQTDALGEVHLSYVNPVAMGADLYFQWLSTDGAGAVLTGGLHLRMHAGVTPDQTALDFGSAVQGTGVTMSLLLVNDSDRITTVNDAIIYDLNATDYATSFPVGPPPIVLAPGASTPLDVTFSPMSTGPSLASLTILHGDLPAGFADPVVNLRGVGLGGPGSELLVNTGGFPYFDSQARIWTVDFGFSGGALGSTGDRILGTADEELYQVFRESPSFSYAFDVPPAKYAVTLHCVDPVNAVPAARVFDVLAEGILAVDDLDLAAVAGEDRAHTETLTTVVTDGTLNLDLVASAGEATLSGLEIRSIFPVLDASPMTLDFGFVSMGDTLGLPLELTNTGTDALVLDTVGFIEGPALGEGHDFTLDLDGNHYVGGHGDVTLPATLSLAPQQSTTAIVTFVPTEHLFNDVILRFDGNFGTLDVQLNAFGGTAGHPFLHVVIQAGTSFVDHDGDGVETVLLDGSFSHTHEPGASLVDFVWTDNGIPVASSAVAQVSLGLGTHNICLTISDDNVPPDTLTDCINVRVDPPWAVAGALALYYPAPGLPQDLLDNVPAHADFAEVRPDMSVQDEGAIGGSPYSENVMVRLLAEVPVPSTDSYDFAAVGGSDQRLEVDGLPVTGPVTLTAGPHSVEARFAVASMVQLPVEVQMGLTGGPLAPIDPASLTHDQTTLVPVINAMPSIGGTSGGTNILISGMGFFPGPDVVLHWGNSVFGQASFDSLSPGLIDFDSPPHAAATITVTVETPQGISNACTFQYDEATTPIAFTTPTSVTVTRPTTGDWGPDGRFYVASRWGQIYAITFDGFYSVAAVDTYPGVSGEDSNEVLGLAFNPFDPPSPVRLYVTHSKLFAQGGGPFSGPAPYPGKVSILTGPNFDVPETIITGLPTSNHDHGVNGLQFNHNGDLFIATAGNTNGGVKFPLSGDLPESPLSGSILKAELSRPDFSGNITYVETDTGLPNNDQVFGELVDVAPGSHVATQAVGLRNPYDIVYTTTARLYATDNGPNSGYGPRSTGPDSEGSHPSAPDELELIEYGNYYGHPNRSRGRTDPRQNIYHGVNDGALPGEFTPQMNVISASTNGICEYRATTFSSQLRGNLIGQRWNGVLKRFVLSADGRTVTAWNDMDNLSALDVQTGPGGALLGIDYSGNAVKVMVPNDAAAVGLTAYDIYPWRATPDGGQPFVIGGAGFGTLSDTTVTIGGLAATLTSVTPKRIHGLLPAQPNPATGLLDVAVTVGLESSVITNAFRYLFAAPGLEPGTWESLPDLPLPLGEVAAGAVAGVVYVVGEGSSLTLGYTVRNRTWSTAPAVRPFVGNHHAAEVIGDKLYLIGGLLGGSEGRVQIYDPALDTWSLGADMPWAGGSVSTAVIDGRIYAAGGIVNNNTVDLCAVYDPAMDSWTSLAPMPHGRNHCAADSDGSRLFIFGGRTGGNFVANGFDDLQIYDPATDTWQCDKDGISGLLPLPRGRGGMGSAVFYRGEFYIFGGETKSAGGATPDNVYDRVDVYDPVANSWRLDASMTVPRHGIYPVLYESRIFVPGGGVVAGNSQSTTMGFFTRQ